MSDKVSTETIGKNLSIIREKVAEAAGRAGRNVNEIRVMAVTKTFPLDYVKMAVDAGIGLFGENRVNEAFEKYILLKHPVELHLIGHLQRNKARTVARIFNCVQSIDKFETAEALNRKCESIGRTMDILFEINTSGEDSKHGFRNEDDYFACLERVMDLKNLKIRGLMTVGPLTDDKKRIRESFRSLKNLYERTRERYRELEFDILSMGMSGDYPIAVEEGSNLIRIGTAIFGKRQ